MERKTRKIIVEVPVNLKAGDLVTRMMGGEIPFAFKVIRVTDTEIHCIPEGYKNFPDYWRFDKETGAEIDDDLNWGPPPKVTGSFITRKILKQ